MDDLAMLRTFYEAYGAYFGDDTPVVVTTQGMDATDRATLAGLRAAIAMEARQRRDAEERPDPKDDSAARRDRPDTPSLQTPQGGDS